ncbi:lactate racemase domain-containing protein [Micromonospora sp. NPDC007271]|uniref:lactate racemase domain-containing protein n=1 Tax=Micromonospora sp. NPDC007271 TaxID=3154587 RepID=UPI0033DC2F10
MSRPGFVLEVDERTPSLLVHEGDGFRLERFPLGTRVVYPPDSLPALPDVDAAIRRALLHPVDAEPLPALLRAGMRLTIVFDDISIPLPQMRPPDIRQRVIEQVLEFAAEAGVDDVELVAANSLHRRMTPAELKRIVGERVFRAFFPAHLRNHDAEDPDGLTHLGTTRHGEDVEINRRAAESDLIVYVNVNLTAMSGGSKSVTVGLASYRSLRHHHNVHTLRHSRSFNDPANSAMHHSYDRMADVLNDHVKVFTVETTVNSDAFPTQLGFLNRREWEWRLADQAAYLAVKRANDLTPPKLRRQLWQRNNAPYGVTGVHAGAPASVHPLTLANVHRQQLTEVPGQSDIGVWGLPYICPYNVNSIMNPILVMSLGLGYFFNLYRNQPIVRPGGVAIFYHPMPNEFHPVHHPSYIDFFEEVLSETTDPVAIETKYEQQYATDPWYVHLYRKSYAYHGVHPFYMWYWGAHAMEHLGDVIFVGADRRTAARMGFRAASTLNDALEMARDTVGSSPSITYLHAPPLTLADVR